jgi:antitoxin component of MazEF toxin-antitoxin module
VSQVIVGKWGKNLAIRLPTEIVNALGLNNSERLDVELRDGEIVIRRAVPRFTLQEMFGGKTPKSGGRLTPEPSIGDLMSVERSSRNDSLGLCARHRRSHLDGLRLDPGPWTGRPASGPGGLSAAAKFRCTSSDARSNSPAASPAFPLLHIAQKLVTAVA